MCMHECVFMHVCAFRYMTVYMSLYVRVYVCIPKCAYSCVNTLYMCVCVRNKGVQGQVDRG